MTHETPRRLGLAFAGLLAVAALAAPSAGAAPTPEVKALQRQVKALTAQVTSLRSELNALKATVGEVATKADAANTAATTATTKTNCIVTATALSQWNNDVYVDPPNTLFMDSGLSISTASDPVSAYVAGISSSCVGSVLPRAGAASFNAFAIHLSPGALVSPH